MNQRTLFKVTPLLPITNDAKYLHNYIIKVNFLYLRLTMKKEIRICPSLSENLTIEKDVLSVS